MTMNETKRSKILVIALLALAILLPGKAFAQDDYMSVEPFTASELDTLLANIALYPDPLLVQVLAASTYSGQIAPAYAWSYAHRDLKGDALSDAIEKANLPYDASVLALLPFPSVLAMMDRYAAWTDQLGDAVSLQNDDVLQAVQRLRKSANKHGHLVSNENVRVSEGQNITITPVKTEYIYVPVYDPYVVYYNYADGYGRISYGPRIWIGARYSTWGWGYSWFDWNTRVIYVRDTRWHSPRRHYWHGRRYLPRHYDRYRPAPRPHRTVGPPLGKSTVRTSTKTATRPASAVWRDPNPERRSTPETRRGEPRLNPVRDRRGFADEVEEARLKSESRPMQTRDDRWDDRRGGRGEPVDIANPGRRSSGSSNTTSTQSSRRDDRDSRSDGSSRGSFGSAIRRR